MPELPDRAASDDGMADVLEAEFDRQKERLSALLGDPPDARDVPTGYWDQLAVSMYGVLLGDLQDVYLTAARQQANGFGTQLGEPEIRTDALVWAMAHVDELVRGFVAKTKQMVSDRIRDAYKADRDNTAALAALVLMLDDGMPATGQLRSGEQVTAEEYAERQNQAEADRLDRRAALLDDVFSRGRADAVVRTSNTRANVEAERRINGRYAIDAAKQVVGVWHTREDDDVCPRCQPIDQLEESRWPAEAAAGPPLHPSCRCYLEWVPTVAGVL